MRIATNTIFDNMASQIQNLDSQQASLETQLSDWAQLQPAVGQSDS